MLIQRVIVAGAGLAGLSIATASSSRVAQSPFSRRAIDSVAAPGP
jgi:hypothetical protein